MRVLVTGASGFVGRRLVPKLLEAGYQVISATGPDAEAGPFRIDLSDISATRALVADTAPDIVVHLAAMSSVGVGRFQPEDVWRANFYGTHAIAQACRELGREIRLVFASSSEVYGRRFDEGPCDETASIAPLSAYARSKAASEFELEDIASNGLAIRALRLFNHTGCGQDLRFVAPSFAAQVARAAKAGGGQIRVGNLEAQRDFTDVDDIIGAYLSVIKADDEWAAPFDIFNVGSGTSRPVREILDVLIAISGANIDVVVDSDLMRPSDIVKAQGIFDKIEHHLDWRASTPLETTLACLYQYWFERI